jgi:hypothetical protein
MTKYIVIVDSYGSRFWHNESNQFHRTDGPAVEYANGDKEWWLNDKLHRTDGPAVEYAYGTKYWYQNGKRHRTDGPAIEWADGTKEWYIEDVKLTEAEFLKRTKVKAPCEDKVVEVDGKRYRLVSV